MTLRSILALYACFTGLLTSLAGTAGSSAALGPLGGILCCGALASALILYKLVAASSTLNNCTIYPSNNGGSCVYILSSGYLNKFFNFFILFLTRFEDQ